MLLATRAGDRQVRVASVGALIAADGGRGGLSTTAVNGGTVGGIPAAKECIRIAAEGVAKLELGVFRGKDVDRRPVHTTWQARLFDRPDIAGTSWFQLKEWTEAALTGRNNALWLKLRDEGRRVADFRFVHPDTVQGRYNRDARRCEYRFASQDGWSEWLPESEFVHFRVGHVAPGAAFAPSPLELHRQALRAILSKITYEGSLYEGGVLQSLAVMLNEKVTPEQAERFRLIYQAENAGSDNHHKVKVFGGGATVETIGLSLEDAQYIESMQFSIDEQARIFGVTASLVGGSNANTKPLTPEHEQMRWYSYGLEPRLARITSTINADAELFGQASRDYVMFGDVTVRADTATESHALVSEVQCGMLLVDEARAKRGLPPLPNGAGQIPQIVPVGGAPNPTPTPYGDPAEE